MLSLERDEAIQLEKDKEEIPRLKAEIENFYKMEGLYLRQEIVIDSIQHKAEIKELQYKQELEIKDQQINNLTAIANALQQDLESANEDIKVLNKTNKRKTIIQRLMGSGYIAGIVAALILIL